MEGHYSFLYRVGTKENEVPLSIQYYGIIHTTAGYNSEDRHEVEGIEQVLFNGTNILDVYVAEEMLDGIEVAALEDLIKRDTYGIDEKVKEYRPRLSTVYAGGIL